MNPKKTSSKAPVILVALMLISCDANQSSVTATRTGSTTETPGVQVQTRKPLTKGETAPLAPPGSKGFGMPVAGQQNAGQPPRPRVSASVTDPRETGTVTLDDLSMSDPYILADEASRTYYLTGSGGSIYTSKDLNNWTGPYGAYDVTGTWMQGIKFVAAAEIHHIKDHYYYAATFGDRNDLVDVIPRRYNVTRNQTMILVSDQAAGPYKPLNKDPQYDYLPHSWDIIDGTLWYENDVPYFVFVNEWMQTVDGTMDYVRLSPDLSKTITEPKVLFRGSEAPWALEMVGNGEMTFGLKLPGWVTDGPELFRTKTGKLGMLWSSWGAHRYLEGVAYSASGTIDGPWVQEAQPLKDDNSGHGMLFTTFEGKRLLVIHHAEGDGPRKPQLYEIDDSGDKLVLGARYHPQ